MNKDSSADEDSTNSDIIKEELQNDPDFVSNQSAKRSGYSYSLERYLLDKSDYILFVSMGLRMRVVSET